MAKNWIQITTIGRGKYEAMEKRWIQIITIGRGEYEAMAKRWIQVITIGRGEYEAMAKRWIQVIAISICALGLFSSSHAEGPNFTRDIRPILSDHCFHCHGPDAETRKADLRLDQEAAAREFGVLEGGRESALWERISAEDPDLQMPPPGAAKPLGPEEQNMLRLWLEQGAPWAKHWAYEPPREHPVPPPTAWAGNRVIDRFVAAGHLQAGVTPAPAADPVTLVRRLHFDLVGLPPSPEDVRAFARNPSEEAYQAIIEKLLQSPRFGERMAAYWLDLVRYADTVGYHGDQDQNISPFRDYVIDAFNRNLPFDQFTREQLAGDLLPHPSTDQRVATGYNRMLQTSHEGGVQPQEYLAIYQADRVRNLSAVWLGGTLGCAQCHDHKYDPYTSHDFYAMAAFFADIDEAQHFKKGTNALPTARPPEIDVLSRQAREALGKVEQALAELPESDARRTQLIKTQKSIQQSKRRTMITVALPEPRTVRLLPRGNWLDESGPVMKPAVPAFLGKLNSSERPSRLDLAHWLTDDQEGIGLLTARVLANRLWYLCFGRGLSTSLDDFGGQGEPPSHPELLDHLARELVARGWDIKLLLRQIVSSQTYRQSALASEAMRARDPDNVWLARQGRYRLPAEMIRDMALSVSDLLVHQLGGASVKPYQPQGYYRHLNFPQRRYAHDADERQWRRGVYIHWQRQFLHPMLKAFDAPTREECTASRPRSNTPLAALVLLNDPTFVEAARGLAERLLNEANSDEDRIERGFALVLSRAPTPAERSRLLSLLQAARTAFSNEEQVDAFLAVGERRPADLPPSDYAAWTTLSRALLNLGEATTRQ